MLNTTRVTIVTIALLGLPVAVGGCDAQNGKAEGRNAHGSAASSAPSTSAMSLAPSASAMSSQTFRPATAPSDAALSSAAPVTTRQQPAAGGAQAADGCTPSDAVLFAALKERPDLYSSVGSPTNGLVNVECRDGYAMAQTHLANTDSAAVLFAFDTDKRQWWAMRTGTTIHCDQIMTRETMAHLSRCYSDAE